MGVEITKLQLINPNYLKKDKYILIIPPKAYILGIKDI